MNNKLSTSTIMLGGVTLVLLVITLLIYFNANVSDSPNAIETSGLPPDTSTNEVSEDSDTERDNYDPLIPLNEHVLLSGLISILLPLDFDVMSDELKSFKYQHDNQPTVVYMNADATVNVAFNHSETPVTIQTLPELKQEISNGLKISYSNATWLRDDTTEQHGTTFGRIEFIVPAADTDIYNLMYMTELHGKLLIVTFNATVALMDEWKPAGEHIMNSLKLLSGTGGTATYHFTMDDLSFIHMDSGARIRFGMSQEEVNALLGEPTVFDHGAGIKMHDYDGLHIYYRDNKSAYMITSVDFESDVDYRTHGNIKLTDMPQTLLDVYGKPSYESKRNFGYVFQSTDEGDIVYRDLTSLNEADEQPDYYLDFLFYNFQGYDMLMNISIVDHQFAKNSN